MKFSYTLVKKSAPFLKSKKELIEKLNEFSFEAVDLKGNSLDVSVPPNRFSDAASHWGIAAEISAVLGKKPIVRESGIRKSGRVKAPFIVKIQDKKLCSRYAAQYFENVKVAPSPKWLREILADCGLRSVNNVVDVMNYAMLETGQPLHAFDYDKLATNKQQLKTIIVRRAKKGEKITTLDDKRCNLDEKVLVISDDKNPLAIAGIKGGKFAEVDRNTRRIIVESANFEGANIYRSSKRLKLSTDASLRFSHNISPELAIIGLKEAGRLLKEMAKAEAGGMVDLNSTRLRKIIIKFDLERFRSLIGLDLDLKTCRKYLERLGFKITQAPAKSAFLVQVPLLRRDVEIFEDLAEEITRLYGYDNLESLMPRVFLHSSGFEDGIVLKDKVRKALTAEGLSEVCNYSFIGEADLEKANLDARELVELENPVSNQLKYLRPCLCVNLAKNVVSNFRFFDEIKIFEIGRVFRQMGKKHHESAALGIALASKKNKEIFFQLKGIIERLFKKIGVVSYLMPELPNSDEHFIPGEVLKIESGGMMIGYLGRLKKKFSGNNEAVAAELNLGVLLKLALEEHEYRPLPKYPSVMRDISILVDPADRVGDMIREIQQSDLKYIEDVDLLDEYELNRKKRSLTLRIVFQAEDRTLTDAEVNAEMKKIEKLLKNRFRAQIR